MASSTREQNIFDNFMFESAITVLDSVCNAFVKNIDGTFEIQFSIFANDVVSECKKNPAIRPGYEKMFEDGMLVLLEYVYLLNDLSSPNFTLCLSLSGTVNQKDNNRYVMDFMNH